jgi:hypothetical protein
MPWSQQSQVRCQSPLITVESVGWQIHAVLNTVREKGKNPKNPPFRSPFKRIRPGLLVLSEKPPETFTSGKFLQLALHCCLQLYVNMADNKKISFLILNRTVRNKFPLLIVLRSFCLDQGTSTENNQNRNLHYVHHPKKIAEKVVWQAKTDKCFGIYLVI